MRYYRPRCHYSTFSYVHARQQDGSTTNPSVIIYDGWGTDGVKIRGLHIMVQCPYDSIVCYGNIVSQCQSFACIQKDFWPNATTMSYRQSLGVAHLNGGKHRHIIFYLGTFAAQQALRKWREGVCFNKTINNHSREFNQERTNFFIRALSIFVLDFLSIPSIFFTNEIHF